MYDIDRLERRLEEAVTSGNENDAYRIRKKLRGMRKRRNKNAHRNSKWDD